MQIHFQKSSGNVLFGTLFITGIICLYLGGYLSLVRNEDKMTKRSQTWNEALPIAEAGIEEAMTHLQTTFPNIKPGNGWSASGTSLVKKRFFNDDYFITIISNNAVGDPIIISTGSVREPIGTNFISRTVKVTTLTTTYTIPGMVVRETANLTGTKIALDSFDSSNSTNSTNGRYDVTKRRDKALLATLSTNAASIDMGNADVWGKLASAHGATITKPITGPNSVVGSTKWHNDGNKGIEAGAYTDDVNMTVDSVTAPFTSALPPPAGVKDKRLGFDWELTGGSNVTNDYRFDGATFGGSVHVTGNVRLLVNGNVALSTLQIESGSSLEMYVAGASADLGGNLVNIDGFASNFKYFGLPTNTKLIAGGKDAFTAMIYAPDADLTLNGNGGTTDFSGASITKSVRFLGNYNFHFDESTKNKTKKGYVIVTWDEI
jgi:hypothetical protein